MKYHKIEHADSCHDIFCGANAEILPIVYNSQYHILEVPQCAMYPHKPHEYVFAVIKKSDKGIKMYKGHDWIWKMDKGNIRDEELKEYRLRGKRLRKWVSEACFHYFDNAGKRHTIYRRRPFWEKLFDDDAFSKSRDAALEITPTSAHNAIRRLWHSNTCVFVQDKEARISTEHFIKQLKKQTA